jgi:hypothetical protein
VLAVQAAHTEAQKMCHGQAIGVTQLAAEQTQGTLSHVNALGTLAGSFAGSDLSAMMMCQ